MSDGSQNTEVRIGTSGWSYTDWKGALYPMSAKSRDFLAHYARHFDTVEVDGTYYRVPSPADCRRWADMVGPGFLFVLKMPKSVVHGGEPRDRNLQDDAIWNWDKCGADAMRFVEATAELGDKRGPVLLQCPCYPARIYPDWRRFLDAIDAFLKRLPPGPQYALEMRNREWLTPEFLDALRQRELSYVMADLRGPSGRQSKRMPPAEDYLNALPDHVTGPLAVIRLIGDRREMEQRTKAWGQVVADRADVIDQWARAIRALTPAGQMRVFVFVNNHFAGYGPEIARVLRERLAQQDG